MNLKNSSHAQKNQILLLIASIVALTSILLLLFALIFNAKKTPVPLLDFKQEYSECLLNFELDSERGACLRELAEKVVANYPPEVLDNGIQQITEEKQLQWCHEFLHYAGWSMYFKEKDMYMAFSKASDKCDSGMYHGVAEAFIKDRAEGRSVSEFIDSVAKTACKSGFDNRVDPKAMIAHCHHGMGHAFMFMADNDLNKSLQYCDMVQSDFGSCYTGVFMENVQSKQVKSGAFHETKYAFTENDPDYPCSILDDQYLSFCYHYKGISNVVRTKGDFRQSFKDCLLVRNDFQSKCFEGVGSNIPGPHWSSATAGKKCDEAFYTSNEAYRKCVIGGMGFLMQLNNGRIQAAVEYCSEIHENYRSVCYEQAGLNYPQWLLSGEVITDRCNEIQNASDRDPCLSGVSQLTTE